MRRRLAGVAVVGALRVGIILTWEHLTVGARPERIAKSKVADR